jgi:hypothetical protein
MTTLGSALMVIYAFVGNAPTMTTTYLPSMEICEKIAKEMLEDGSRYYARCYSVSNTKR